MPLTGRPRDSLGRRYRRAPDSGISEPGIPMTQDDQGAGD